MMVWNFPCRAAGPSPTSMYLLSGETGEASWAWVRACASSRDSNLVDGEHTSRDLGRDKVAWPTDARCRKTLIGNMSLNSWCWKLSIQWCRKSKLFSRFHYLCFHGSECWVWSWRGHQRDWGWTPLPLTECAPPWRQMCHWSRLTLFVLTYNDQEQLRHLRKGVIHVYEYSVQSINRRYHFGMP